MGIVGRLNELEFSRSSAAAREGRRWVRASLVDLEVDDPERTAELLVSELISNAVLHTDARPTAWIERTDDRVRIHVQDDGGGGTPVVLHPEPHEGTGRGLAIVEHLALRWGVDHHDRGKSVWFEIPARPRGAHA